jgi:hypothetical protein
LKFAWTSQGCGDVGRLLSTKALRVLVLLFVILMEGYLAIFVFESVVLRILALGAAMTALASMGLLLRKGREAPDRQSCPPEGDP